MYLAYTKTFYYIIIIMYYNIIIITNLTNYNNYNYYIVLLRPSSCSRTRTDLDFWEKDCIYENVVEEFTIHGADSSIIVMKMMITWR